MLRDTRDKGRTAPDGAGRIMAPVGRWGKEGSSLLAFGERRKSRHRYCIIERSELGKTGGLAVGVKRRASIFRFRSAHRGKSFDIAADAEMTNVLPGICLGSLASVVGYISGLTEGSRLIPFCPLGKFSDIGAAAEMSEGFLGGSA